MKALLILFVASVGFLSFSFRSNESEEALYAYSFKVMNPDDFDQKKDIDAAIDKIFEGKTKSKVIDFKTKAKKYEVVSAKRMNQKEIELGFVKFGIEASDLRISFFSSLTDPTK